VPFGVSTQAGVDHDPILEGARIAMTMVAEKPKMLATLAEQVDAVVGGDTHRDTHTLEITSPIGSPIASVTIPNTDAGFAAALTWITRHAPGSRVVVGLEGTRSYGIGLARALKSAGLQVVEVERPKRGVRRRGKSDPIDAHLAALSVLRMPVTKIAQPRADGDREALRILLTARRAISNARTGDINQLRALLLAGTDTDRTLARGHLSDDTLNRIARRRGTTAETIEQAVRRAEARRLALAIRTATTELKANKQQLEEIVEMLAPGLTRRVGIGPISAAQAIVSWSHRGRCRNDAAFAALAGANPIPASSGRTTRHRLNRGGDRRLNEALHVIALNRWRVDDRTHDYITRRRAEGKTDREIRRALKRYIAREIFKALEHAA
jgi:transposase